MDCWIGTDESGKGDYFGGLAIAGIMVDSSTLPVLREVGVRDSKKLSDTRALELSRIIKKTCLHSIVLITPPKYNELYSKMRNLNRILAWGHARVIENILSERDCKLVVADKFGDVSYIENALMKKGKEIKLIQRTKGEEDIAVASASILARSSFLESLKTLSSSIGLDLPKGATTVETVARELVKKHGKEILNKIAKLHFKTTISVYGGSANGHTKANSQDGFYCTQKDMNSNVTESEKNNMAEKPVVSTTQQRLWAPWRDKYIQFTPERSASERMKEDGCECIFCSALRHSDEQRYVLHRDERAFVIMNIYPYSNGHLMVAPMRHIGNISELSLEETTSIFQLIRKCVEILGNKFSPDGFNIGMNIGVAAGAGVAGHLHIHIVPRWFGDTNFMPIVSDTKVISQSLDETYKLLKQEF